MDKINIRKPVVSGQFYAPSANSLKAQIEGLIDKDALKIEVIACVMPHAGYMYSGRVAGATASRISIKDKIILLGPNHTGLGAPFSIMTSGRWQTPLGEIKIDAGLADKILKSSKYLKADDLAHAHEHSLEVELPFLQYFKNDFEFVPIAILSDELNLLKELGRDIASAVSANKDSILIIASTDMTHYEPQAEAEKKDKEAIQAILELNEDKLMSKVNSLNITMCGYAPTIAAICAAKALGATKAELVKYETSGDVTGDRDSVVGYAGIIIY